MTINTYKYWFSANGDAHNDDVINEKLSLIFVAILETTNSSSRSIARKESKNAASFIKTCKLPNKIENNDPLPLLN